LLRAQRSHNKTPGLLPMGKLITILITYWWHSSIFDLRSVRRADSDTDHYLQKLGKDWQEVNKQHRSLKQKDLISVSQMSWWLGNNIRLISQTGLQLWRN